MKTRTIILLVVAVVCGLGASYMTSRLLADRGTPPPVATVKVPVARQKVAACTPIKEPEKWFQVKEVPEGAFSSKCISDPKEVQNQCLKQPLNADLPVTRDDLLSSDTAGITYKLNPGERAVALKVHAEAIVGGFVQPDSRVDVLAVIHRGDADSYSQIIMHDMRVLAIDAIKSRDSERDNVIGSTVTLAAKPDEAQRLSLASSLGELRLVLRNPVDQDKPDTKASDLGDLAKKDKNDDTSDAPADPNEHKGGGTPGGVDVKLPPTPPDHPPVDKAPPPVVEAPKPEEKPARTHTLRIESGETVTKAVFVWDEKANDWSGGAHKP
jgi:pilus assembly protein CpaB